MKLQRFGVSCKIRDHQATDSITYMQQIHIDYTGWRFPIHNTRSPKPINNHCASLPLLVHRACPLLGPGHTATNVSDFPSLSWWFGQEREIWARNDTSEKSSWDLAFRFFLVLPNNSEGTNIVILRSSFRTKCSPITSSSSEFFHTPWKQNMPGKETWTE